jgi:cytokinin dehydrogenase
MSGSAWTEEATAALLTVTGASVRRDPATRADFAEDFGHLVQAQPWAVATPRDVDELSAVVRFAAQQRLPLCPRGRGYSQSGQALSPAGLSVDLSRLDRIEPIRPTDLQAHCEAGTRWRELTRATLEFGLVPRVVPLNLDISVGGLISAGGIGSNAYRHGPVVSQIPALEVVTGGGRIIRCSAAETGDLFFAVLGGLGRCGIVARAAVALRPAPARVRTFHLVYDEIEPWFADQQRLVSDRRVDHIEAMCWMGAKGFRSRSAGQGSRVQWLYGIQVGVEYSDIPPDQTEALRAVTPWRVVHVDDETFSDFIARYQPRFDGMRQSGAWQQLHPWLECLLPPERLVGLLPTILDELPTSLGDGHRVLWIDTSKKPPLFATPDGNRAVCLAILPTGVAASEREHVLPALARIDALLRKAGGKRYLSGWLGTMDADRWREHHGGLYESWTGLKRRFDPDRILRSALFPDG